MTPAERRAAEMGKPSVVTLLDDMAAHTATARALLPGAERSAVTVLAAVLALEARLRALEGKS